MTRRNRSVLRARSPLRPSQIFTPGSLAPRAWYDAHLGGSATQITDSSGYGRAPVTFAAAGASPSWLQYDGTPSVYFSGDDAQNHVSTPHNAAFNWTQLEVSWCGEIPPAGPWSTVLVRGNGNGSDTSVHLLYDPGTAGYLYFRIADSTGNFVLNAQTNFIGGFGLSLGRRYWFNVTLNSATGAWQVRYNTSTDPATEPASWTTVNSGTIAAFTPLPSTEPLEIGAVPGYGYPYLGRLSRVVYRTTIGGTPVADWRAADTTQTGVTDAYGRVWTVNRRTTGRKTVVLSPAAGSDRSMVLFGTDDFANVPDAAVPPAHPETWVVVFRPHATPAVNSEIVSNYANANTKGISPFFSSTTTVGTWTQDGSGANNTTSVAYTAGQRSVFSYSRTGANNVSVRMNNGTAVVNASTLGSSAGGVGYYIARDANGAYADIEFEALLTFDRVLTAGEIAQLVAYYRGG